MWKEFLKRLIVSNRGDCIFITYRKFKRLCIKAKVKPPDPYTFNYFMTKFAKRDKVFRKGGKIRWIVCKSALELIDDPIKSDKYAPKVLRYIFENSKTHRILYRDYAKYKYKEIALGIGLDERRVSTVVNTVRYLAKLGTLNIKMEKGKFYLFIKGLFH